MAQRAHAAPTMEISTRLHVQYQFLGTARLPCVQHRGDAFGLSFRKFPAQQPLPVLPDRPTCLAAAGLKQDTGV